MGFSFSDLQPHPFVPHPLLRAALLQTLAPTFLSPARAFSRRVGTKPAARIHEVGLPDGDSLVLLENLAGGPFCVKEPEPSRSLVFLLAPGLASSAGAPNLVRLACTLAHRGVKAWRLNHRGMGEGAGRARGIYHAGRAEDLLAALRYVVSHEGSAARIVLVGYSLSGNMALLMAGRHADTLPRQLAGVIAASPVLDLAANAPLIGKAASGFYDGLFLRDLRKTVTNRHTSFPDLGPVPSCLGKSLAEFDALYTAHHAGFVNREAYYAECSSLPWLSSIRVPAHIIASRDDPFSQADPREFPTTMGSTLTDAGGHHGFFASTPCPHGNRFWLDGEIMRVAQAF